MWVNDMCINEPGRPGVYGGGSICMCDTCCLNRSDPERKKKESEKEGDDIVSDMTEALKSLDENLETEIKVDEPGTGRSVRG